MAEKSKNQTSLFAAVLVLILLLVVGFQLMGMREKLAAAQTERAALVDRVARQEQENRSLEAALERAGESEFLQQLAREQLGMVSPGEKDFYDVSN